MKRVHVIVVVVVLLVILFGFMFFMRKKERYSRDASVLIGGEKMKNRIFKAGENFNDNFNEMVKYDIEYQMAIHASNDFTGTFSLKISNDKNSTIITYHNFEDIQKFTREGVNEGRAPGSETSITKTSLQLSVVTGTVAITLLVIANGPVNGAPSLASLVNLLGSPPPAPGSTIGPVKNVNSFGSTIGPVKNVNSFGSTIGSPTPAHVMYSDVDVETFRTALKQNTSLNQNEITIVVNAVTAFAENPTSLNLSQIKRLQSVYAGKFPDEKEKKDKLNQAVKPLVSPGIEKMMEKNHIVSGTHSIYECSSDSTGFACKLHTP
jgi:hypothetical protein